MRGTYETCDAKLRQPYPDRIHCNKPAGWGTKHVGEGRCRLHGGNSLVGPDHPRFKHGLTSKYTKEKIKELAEEFLASDEDLFQMKEEIATFRALFVHTVNAGTVEDAVNVLEKLVKAIKSYSEMERGRKVVVDVQMVRTAMRQVVAVIQRHIKDPLIIDRIAHDIQRLDLLGDGEGVIPGTSESSGVVTRLALED